MWPATSLSVTRGSIHEKSSNLKFVEQRVRLHYICLTELLELDKVHLHKNNEYYFFFVLICFIYLFCD